MATRTVRIPGVRIRAVLDAEWKWVKPEVAMNMIAGDATTMRVLTDIANTVATKARTSLGSSMKEAPTAEHHRLLPPKGKGGAWSRNPSGRIWWASPGRVAAGITVKDSGKVFTLKSGKVVVAREMWSYATAGSVAVALVIANHPYSASFEVGGDGIKGKSYMSMSAKRAAALYSGVEFVKAPSIRNKGYI